MLTSKGIYMQLARAEAGKYAEAALWNDSKRLCCGATVGLLEYRMRGWSPLARPTSLRFAG
jgi:hypothetical protein